MGLKQGNAQLMWHIYTFVSVQCLGRYCIMKIKVIINSKWILQYDTSKFRMTPVWEIIASVIENVFELNAKVQCGAY